MLNSTLWEAFTPFTKWAPRVTRDDLQRDLVAGITGALVVLPQGVAFASIAGMPPEYGLYAGIVPAIVAALFGSSRHLVSGPTTAASIVLFSALSVQAVPESAQYVTLALTLTFMVGLFELALGLARMGALVNFISHSVVVGFTAGAAVLIAAKQLKHFFGIEMPSGGHLHHILIAFVEQIDRLNPYVTSVAAATLLSGILLKIFARRIPYLIVSMVVGSLVGVFLNARFGQEVTGIATVGALPTHLPPLSAPDLTFDTIKELAPTALAMTLFALTEAVSIGRSLAARGGYRINGSQEFVGQGLSNIFGAFFSGYVATGSFNRSGLNYEAGARTPFAAVFAGGLLMVVLLFVAPLAVYLPKATMAGLLFLVAWGLFDFKEIGHILKASGRETAVLLVTFFSALFLELELAIFAGVMLSLIMYLERVSKPTIRRQVPDPYGAKRVFVSDPALPECPQLRFAQIDGSIFFGNVNRVEDTFDLYRNTHPDQKHLAIVAQAIRFVDLQGAEAFVDEAKKRKEMGGGLYIVNAQIPLWEILESLGSLDDINEKHFFQGKTAAVHAIYQKLDKTVCKGCNQRIFTECMWDHGVRGKPAPGE
ncbi:SulP family sulfate permease [Rhodobium orientis]|uniref:Sodium-independent anion transporter n=1 Tax=Rhodobium orientis TaxID=34017 RepID=A0A327JFD7_9HYPH|nr:SulP family inorganic anion transporter [Rhodobium orientis]MBB4305556.1 SulP family sulfate permease [Rhodobium orientis]MBK5948734.1 sodium-independent anion transporter [Rhodobium orientis]RAI25110.1 sodium-independent anion transporter [Rhodobium orientis]